MSALIDITGKRFGRLVVTRRVGHSGANKSAYWECICDCGNTKAIDGRSLRHGKTISCGCWKNEKMSKRFKKHGMSKTLLYDVWSAMKARCLNQKNKDYPNYGGRGIRVCPEWVDSFAEFRRWACSAGYKEGLSIDRIDVDGNYEPENCQWVNDLVQANNRTNNRIITYLGRDYSMSQFSKAFKINYSSLRSRLNLGWSAEDIIDTPFIQGRNQYGA